MHRSALVATFGLAACSAITPLPRDGTPPDGRIITQEMIAATNARTAWDVVKSTGLFQMSDGSSSTRPSIRGRRGRSSILIGSADVPQLIVDGTRVNDASYLHSIPATTIDYVHILNGVDGSAREGLNSGAGVIYITRRSGA